MRSSAAPRIRGFSLTELMVALAVTGLAMVSVIGFHVGNKLRNASEDMNVEVQQNLRLGMDRIQSAVRNSNYGVPTTSLSNWFTWVSGFTTNPVLTAGSPSSLTIAGCGLKPLTTLSANAAAGATTLQVADGSGFNATNRRVIYIDDMENARIQSVGGNSLSIDTNPSLAGVQGLKRAYPAGTPICRVDVTTFSIDTTNKRLLVNFNQGGNSVPLADGISDLAITLNSTGTDPLYAITMSGQSTRKDPTTNTPVQATLTGRATPLQ